MFQKLDQLGHVAAVPFLNHYREALDRRFHAIRRTGHPVGGLLHPRGGAGHAFVSDHELTPGQP